MFLVRSAKIRQRHQLRAQNVGRQNHFETQLVYSLQLFDKNCNFLFSIVCRVVLVSKAVRKIDHSQLHKTQLSSNASFLVLSDGDDGVCVRASFTLCFSSLFTHLRPAAVKILLFQFSLVELTFRLFGACVLCACVRARLGPNQDVSDYLFLFHSAL